MPSALRYAVRQVNLSARKHTLISREQTKRGERNGWQAAGDVERGNALVDLIFVSRKFWSPAPTRGPQGRAVRQARRGGPGSRRDTAVGCEEGRPASSGLGEEAAAHPRARET